MFRVSKEVLPTHHARLVVEATPEGMERLRRQVAQRLSSQTRVPGFRPGKAPYGVVLRYFGESAVQEELLHLLMERYFDQILQEADVRLGGIPQLREVRSWDPLVLEFEVPMAEEVELPPEDRLEVPYQPPDVTDEDIERALENLRRMHVGMKPVDRPAQIGDLVRLKLKGEYRLPEEDAEPRTIPEDEITLLVKEDDDPEEWPFPGFSKQLVGLKAGDTRTLTYTYPDDFPNEDMRGYTFTYEVEVLEVQTPEYPELTDEFVKTYTEYDTVEALREGLKARLAEDRKLQYDREYRQQVLDALVEQSQVRFPRQQLEHEVEARLEDLKEQLKRQGITWEEYLEEKQQSEDDIKAQLEREAERDLRRLFVLDALVRAYNVQLDNEEVRQVVAQLLYELQRETGRTFRDENQLMRFLEREPHWQERLRELTWVRARQKALNQLVERLKARSQAGEEAEEQAHAAGPAETQDTPAADVEEPDREDQTVPASSAEAGEAPSSREGGEA